MKRQQSNAEQTEVRGKDLLANFNTDADTFINYFDTIAYLCSLIDSK